MTDQINQPDYSGATDALSQALTSMQMRLDHLTSAQAPLTTERKQYLEHMVETLLPDISPRVEANLRQNVPWFVTSDISRTFASNRKILGIFASAKYNQALALLQTRLAAYLDQQKYGKLEALDNEIAGLSSEITSLRSQIQRAMDLISVLQQAEAAKVPLAPAAAEQVDRLAEASRIGPTVTGSSAQPRRTTGAVKTRSSATSSSSSSSGSYSYSSDDNSDLWFYFMTDIPISLRTVVINAVIEHREADAVARSASTSSTLPVSSAFDTGTSGSWDTSPPPVSDLASQICTADSAAADMAAAVSATATNDSLGYFS